MSFGVISQVYFKVKLGTKKMKRFHCGKEVALQQGWTKRIYDCLCRTNRGGYSCMLQDVTVFAVGKDPTMW